MTISQARDPIPPAIGKLKEENPFIFKEIKILYLVCGESCSKIGFGRKNQDLA